MEKSEANAIKIADYLEDKMPIEAQEIFMRELELDEVLRNQYEEELLLRAMLNNGADAVKNTANFFQPADEHIAMIKTALEKKQPANGQPKLRTLKLYGSIAAILILVIAGVVFFVSKNNNVVKDVAVSPAYKDSIINKDSFKEQQGQVAKTNNPGKAVTKKDSAIKSPLQNQIAKTSHSKDSVTKIDTGVNEPQLAMNNNTADELFKKFNKPYAATSSDPHELNEYLEDLQNGDYNNLLAASDADYQLMGSGDRNDLLKQYMNLYRGLGSMAKNNYANAVKYFEEATSFQDNNNAFYAAQWYLSLSYVKEKNSEKALAILNNIIAGTSAFKPKAIELKKELIK